jgi:ABC-2 type transport system permease protein
MKFHRIKGLLMRHLYLYKRSLPRIMDIAFWPVTELVVWGFLTTYLSGLNMGNVNLVTVLLGAIIFWDLLRQAQQAVSISFLEDVWERNFLNLFVTPLKVGEFIASTAFLALIRLLLVGIVMGTVAILFYHFNIFTFGILLFPFVALLFIFGFSLGLFTTGIILRFGTSAQILAWGFIFLIQPFSAVFYPVSALPQSIQFFSYLFPSTYVFEGMRSVVATGIVPASALMWGGITNVLYLVASIWFFYAMFSRVKKQGLLLKLD